MLVDLVRRYAPLIAVVVGGAVAAVSVVVRSAAL